MKDLEVCVTTAGVPVDEVSRARLLAVALQERNGRERLPVGRIEIYADAAGVSPRTFRRWMENGAVPALDPDRWLPDDDEQLLYFEFNGSVPAVRKEMLRQLGVGERTVAVPSYSTLLRGYREALTKQEREYAKRGEAGWREFALYCHCVVLHRNAEWQADHKQLDVLVVPEKGGEPTRPWATMFIDSATRALLAYALTLGTPTQAEVLAAFREAIRVDPARGPFGGVPRFVIWDNGLEFLAKAVTQAAIGISHDCRVVSTDSYAPWQKGKIERLNRTVSSVFLAGLPFHTKGRRDRRGRLYGPGTGPIDWPLFTALFEEAVLDYNNERGHSELDGLTPAEAWREDDAPVRTLPDDELSWLFLKRQPRKVQRQGVSFPVVKWMWSPHLANLVGKTVEIRFMPGDYRSVEVFFEGKHICTAVPRTVVSQADKDLLREVKREDRREMARVQRRITAKQRRRYESATGPVAEVIEIGAVSERDVRDAKRRRPAKELAKTAKSNLYGISDDVFSVIPERDSA